MPRDFKHRAQSNNAPRPVPGFIWFVTGLLVGALSVGLICLKYQIPKGQPTPVTAERESPSPIRQAKPTETKPALEYDFPDLLKKMEWGKPVSESDIPAPEAVRPAPITTPKESIRFRLQVGSYNRFGDADRRKAQLALQGYPTKIVQSQVNGQKVFRLYMGPYPSEHAARDKRGELKKRGIDSLLTKLP